MHWWDTLWHTVRWWKNSANIGEPWYPLHRDKAMQECKYPSYKNDWHTPCSVNSRCQCSHRSDMPPESETASRAFDDYKPNWLSDRPTPASWSICADDWHLCVLLLATVHTQGCHDAVHLAYHTIDIIHTRWRIVEWVWVNSSCLGRGIWWIRSEPGLKWWEVHGFAKKVLPCNCYNSAVCILPFDACKKQVSQL